MITILRDVKHNRMVATGDITSAVESALTETGFTWDQEESVYFLDVLPEPRNERVVKKKLDKIGVEVTFSSAEIANDLTPYTVYRTDRYIRTKSKDIPDNLKSLLTRIAFRYVPRPGCYLWRGGLDEPELVRLGETVGLRITVDDFNTVDDVSEPPTEPIVVEKEKSPKTGKGKTPKAGGKTTAEKAPRAPRVDAPSRPADVESNMIEIDLGVVKIGPIDVSKLDLAVPRPQHGIDQEALEQIGRVISAAVDTSAAKLTQVLSGKIKAAEERQREAMTKIVRSEMRVVGKRLLKKIKAVEAVQEKVEDHLLEITNILQDTE